MVNLIAKYNLFYFLIDIIITFLIGLFTQTSGEIIMSIIFIRLIFFPIINITVMFLIKRIIKSDTNAFISSFFIIYFIIILFIYLIKPGKTGLDSLFIEIHSDTKLYFFIYIPYIMSSIISFLIVRFNFMKRA